MKLILFVCGFFIPVLLFGQTTVLKKASNWKLYNIADENAFQYRIDTLKNFSFLKLNDDTMHSFMTDVSALPSDGPHIWMGAYIATYEINGVIRKVELSHYGGVLYDEANKKHYQVAENKIQEWLVYIRESFMTAQKASQ